MWKNNNKNRPYYNINTFNNAKKIVDKYCIKTPLVKLNTISEKLNKPVFLKDESKQITNSFKLRGVSYVIYNKIQEIIKSNRYNVSLVTQSTGNHAIATIYSIYIIAKHMSSEIINSINPIIFSTNNIQNVKLNKIKYYLSEFRKLVNDQNRGKIIYNYNYYEEALKAREEYMKNNESIYIAHGSEDTIIGHGTMGLEIKNQLNYPEDTKICFLASCGAGGPIGIGACLKHLYKNSKFIIVQTEDQNALIESLKTGKIVKNKDIDKNLPFNYADGIAVDKPEEDAIKICNIYANYGITVKHIECLQEGKKLKDDIKLSTNYDNILVGGTTASVYKAVKQYKDYDFIKNSDVIIILGCEGNIEESILKYIYNQ